MRPQHKKAHPTCEFGATTWGECDKARDNAKADWDAMQQVILAARIVDRGDGKSYRKHKDLFGQVVQWLNGDREDLMNDEGNPNMGPWAVRLRDARTRYLAGDLPRYNLYTPPVGQA